MEITTVLHNKKCWFTTDGRLEVYSPRLATKLNKYLKTYDNGNYIFQSGEEVVFKVPSDLIGFIREEFLVKKSTQKQVLLPTVG
jgi:hypothetical protein